MFFRYVFDGKPPSLKSGEVKYFFNRYSVKKNILNIHDGSNAVERYKFYLFILIFFHDIFMEK